MEISEANKKEADNVAELYLKYCHYSTDRTAMSRERATEVRRKYAIECAIINRQSVLDKLGAIYYKKCNVKSDVSESIYTEITNLTEQKEYLKSKL
jgi:hypothetical protein